MTTTIIFRIICYKKYIQNLNAGQNQLVRNERLINLKKYCVDAITAGKYGDEPLNQLNAL